MVQESLTLEKKTESQSKVLVECCVCNATRFDGIWVDKPSDVNQNPKSAYSQLIKTYEGVLRSHGYCPSCYKKAMEEIDQWEQELKQNKPNNPRQVPY
jgi:hypothetical protein